MERIGTINGDGTVTLDSAILSDGTQLPQETFPMKPAGTISPIMEDQEQVKKLE